MPKIAITPSMQFHNQYCCAPQVEGSVMGDMGRRVVAMLNGAGIESRLFWSTDENGWVPIADAAAEWGDYVVAFHTDSAGDKRGYTGALLCYGDSAEGRALGWTIMRQMQNEFAWPISGESYRQNDLHMLQLGTPSCLIEIANHSGPDDCGFILNNMDKFAAAIAHGISQYLGIQPGGGYTMSDVEITPMIERASNNDGIRRFTMFIDESIEDEWVCLGLPNYGEDPLVIEVYYLDNNGKAIGLGETVTLRHGGPQYAQKRVREGIVGNLNVDCHGLKGDAPYFRHVRV